MSERDLFEFLQRLGESGAVEGLDQIKKKLADSGVSRGMTQGAEELLDKAASSEIDQGEMLSLIQEMSSGMSAERRQELKEFISQTAEQMGGGMSSDFLQLLDFFLGGD